jgi:hypothetical protein
VGRRGRRRRRERGRGFILRGLALLVGVRYLEARAFFEDLEEAAIGVERLWLLSTVNRKEGASEVTR